MVKEIMELLESYGYTLSKGCLIRYVKDRIFRVSFSKDSVRLDVKVAAQKKWTRGCVIPFREILEILVA